MNKILVKVFLDPLERAGSTFLQQFIALLVATGSAGLLGFQDWGQAATVAGFAAALSLLTSLATAYVPPLSPLADFWVRVIKTGLQSFVAVLVADQATSFVNADWKSALSTALLTVVGVFIKGGAMAALNPVNGASALPTGLDTSTVSDAGTLDLLPADESTIDDSAPLDPTYEAPPRHEAESSPSISPTSNSSL